MSNSPGSAILTQIRRSRTDLSPAEQRVADLVLSKPRSVLSDPIHDIALAAQVSQPTVIRFCRSVGCKGLSDFKLRLASGLSMSVPITHSQVTLDDSMLELGAKVLGNTANAILQLRNELQRESIDRAIELVAAADRVSCLPLAITQRWPMTRKPSFCAWDCLVARTPSRTSKISQRAPFSQAPWPSSSAVAANYLS
jgi:glucokinase